MSDTNKDQDELTEEEAAKRRDEALKRALNTPPSPHGKLKRKQRNGRDRRGKQN